eukprot:CAMPEP_0184292048 /NCGR_PEP_ID=MMETSP1049-20130417/3904_1 /TAXON_ID=77928 /ORGANISM="Proteomonas sulcata, Strain CCMP704" /LENGTH=333 /DNA_ID=CAMNT_0026599675 /DNA_START=128 /DNA_END=1129 /DNA_ORIENTATION=-
MYAPFIDSVADLTGFSDLYGGLTMDSVLMRKNSTVVHLWNRVIQLQERQLMNYNGLPDHAHVREPGYMEMLKNVSKSMFKQGILKVKIMDECDFRDGFWYARNSYLQSKCSGRVPYILNNNGVRGNKIKVARARQWNHWFLTAQRECSNYSHTMNLTFQSFTRRYQKQVWGSKKMEAEHGLRMKNISKFLESRHGDQFFKRLDGLPDQNLIPRREPGHGGESLNMSAVVYQKYLSNCVDLDYRENVDFVGGDLSHDRISVESASDCCLWCAVSDLCKAFIFVHGDQSCWLKRKISIPVIAKKRTTSGVLKDRASEAEIQHQQSGHDRHLRSLR